MTGLSRAACPWCGYPLNAHFGRSPGDVPAAGDVSVCVACRKVSVFESPLALRKPTSVETLEIAGHADVAEAVAFLERLHGDLDAALAAWRRAGLS